MTTAIQVDGVEDAWLAESFEAAEDRLDALARAGGPLRCVAAALASRLHAKRSWEPLGFARLGDYARERLGVSARSVQELACVGRALASLPGLETALVSGRLPWSKVRLLARFVTPEDEAGAIRYAAGVSVRQLEVELRAVDRGARGQPLPSSVAEADREGVLGTDEEGASTESSELVRLSVPMGLRFKWQRACAYAAQVGGENAPPGTVLEWVTAESLSSLSGLVDDDAESEDRTTGTERETPGGLGSQGLGGEAADVCAFQSSGNESAAGVLPEIDRGHDAVWVSAAPEMGNCSNAVDPKARDSRSELPVFLRALLDGLEKADAFELDARLRRARRLEQRIDAEVAPLLRSVTSAEYSWRRRFRTQEACARGLGMSPRKARALLRIERAGDACPALRAAWRDGTLSWVQAQTLTRLVEGGDVDHAFLAVWVGWALGVTAQRLAKVVDEALLLRAADPVRWSAVREAPERIGGGIEIEMCGSERGGKCVRDPGIRERAFRSA